MEDWIARAEKTLDWSGRQSPQHAQYALAKAQVEALLAVAAELRKLREDGAANEEGESEA